MSVISNSLEWLYNAVFQSTATDSVWLISSRQQLGTIRFNMTLWYDAAAVTFWTLTGIWYSLCPFSSAIIWLSIHSDPAKMRVKLLEMQSCILIHTEVCMVQYLFNRFRSVKLLRLGNHRMHILCRCINVLIVFSCVHWYRFTQV